MNYNKLLLRNNKTSLITLIKKSKIKIIKLIIKSMKYIRNKLIYNKFNKCSKILAKTYKNRIKIPHIIEIITMKQKNHLTNSWNPMNSYLVLQVLLILDDNNLKIMKIKKILFQNIPILWKMSILLNKPLMICQ